MIESRREMLFGWGRANYARSRVYRPETPGEVGEAVTDARARGLTICHRGAGQSYGDAAINQGGAVIHTTGLDRVLEYDPQKGLIRVQAGVTIDQLWRRVIGDGWWPPVVPGTSRPTLGGCLAMNVHGKNHVQAGSFAEHVRSVTVLGPKGKVETLNSGDVGFDRHVGAQGMSGTIMALELELVPVESGFLQVVARSFPNLRTGLKQLRILEENHDYTVGWIDCFAQGESRGRGELHAASYLPEGHCRAGAGLSVSAQTPESRILGLMPRSRVHQLLRGVVHDPGMRALNAAKYAHARAAHPSRYLEPHASFHFLLDYIPGWKRAYGPGGLVQYQFFVPEEAAAEVFEEALRLQHDRGLVSYLGVLKRHRRDPYETNYSVNGYSLALDFPVRERRLPELMSLVADFDSLQRDHGGRVYAAKDAVSQLGKLSKNRADVYGSNLTRRWRERSRIRQPS